MLQGISWTNYLEGLGVATAIYYTGVGFVFFRQEIKGLLAGKFTSVKKYQADATDDTATFEDLESLVHEIDSILEASGNPANKAELLPQLKARLANFSGLREPAYQAAVFNHIIKQAEEISGVRISEDELGG